MAEAVSSTAASAVGAGVVLPFLAAMGIDPASMGAGMAGVIVSQTLMPKTTETFLSVAFLAVGSMLFASFTAPFLAPALIAHSSNWDWLKGVPHEHVKATSAGFLGAFAQPLFALLTTLVAKWRGPRSTPPQPPKE